MFSLASGIYQSYFATPQLTVLLIGAEGVGKTTLLERLKVTQFSTKEPQVARPLFRRTISCPAPPKYANAVMDDDDDDGDDNDKGLVIPDSTFGSHSDPMPSKRWLEERQQSSLENIEWITTDENASRTTRKIAIEEEVQPEELDLTSNTIGTEMMKEYNIKSGLKMLPMEKIRPTSGQNLAKIDICGAKCHVFDISGKFSDLWERYYGDAEAVIYCWHLLQDDRAQRALLETVRKEIPDDVPILIFGHIMMTATTSTSNGDDPAVDELPIMSTSFFLPNYHSNLMQVYCGNAKNGKGVREAMEWLVPMAKRQAKLRAQAAAAAEAAANEIVDNRHSALGKKR